MSNTFNISVKPEISAVSAKVDANKTVIDAIKNDTGPIRNDVTAIHDTNLPVVMAKVSAIRNDVTAIHDSMLPSVKLDTAALRNDVTDIHDTDLPLVKTDTGAIRNDINDINAIVNAIKTKTDALPQSFRGTIRSVKGASSLQTWNTILDVSGSGILLALPFRTTDLSNTVSVQIVYDGITCVGVSHTGDTDYQFATPDMASASLNIITLNSFSYSDGFMKYLNLEFTTTLLIQIKRIGTPVEDVEALPIYILDGI